jgi:hypothetical protein
MQAYSAPPGDAWQLGAGPFIFRGKPPFLSGQLELINHSDEKLKVRAIRTGPAGPVSGTAKSKSASTVELGEIRLAARLLPGERVRVAAHLVVDPSTPPGSYAADLDLDRQRERMIVHVFEKHSVVLVPKTLELRGAPGDVLRHLLVVTNRGNVKHTFPEVALVHLEERDWFGRSLVYALRETAEDDGYQRYLDRVVREMRRTDMPPARVRIHSDVSELAPGATAEVELELTLPDRLIKGRSYTRTIPFMSTSLTFRVVCNGAAKSKKRRPL